MFASEVENWNIVVCFFFNLFYFSSWISGHERLCCCCCSASWLGNRSWFLHTCPFELQTWHTCARFAAPFWTVRRNAFHYDRLQDVRQHDSTKSPLVIAAHALCAEVHANGRSSARPLQGFASKVFTPLLVCVQSGLVFIMKSQEHVARDQPLSRVIHPSPLNAKPRYDVTPRRSSPSAGNQVLAGQEGEFPCKKCGRSVPPTQRRLRSSCFRRHLKVEARKPTWNINQ